MKNIYDEYKMKLVEGINKVMGKDYVTFEERPIDDLEVTYRNEVGIEELEKLQKYYGVEE